MHKRKNFPYLPRNELHSAFNRKISAYFTSADQGQETSYLNESEAGRGFEYVTKSA
ncbi:hypothetical protein M3610_26125 [Neobacillus sp. MER 74]|uniref:hypothetical protein n=1 Tax=Neobacillus sp. MER 74 TaxID=2939566 RepID=UPI00203C47D3|nr:hypothetical protein [Neobacillus sp. MER 74]MCM3118667.1 hypothetical protein [Neobacillus sp. MER 74]